MGDERTLVKVVHYRGLFDRDSLEIGRVFVDEVPVEVLKNVFLDYHVAFYLGNAPWLINVGEDHTYLYISSFGGDSKFMRCVEVGEELYGEIGSARRKERIHGGERIEKAHDLLERVHPKRGNLRYSFASDPNASIYSDFLSALGFDIDFSRISGWIGEIAEREHWEDFRERTERAARLNELADVVL